MFSLQGGRNEFASQCDLCFALLPVLLMDIANRIARGEQTLAILLLSTVAVMRTIMTFSHGTERHSRWLDTVALLRPMQRAMTAAAAAAAGGRALVYPPIHEVPLPPNCNPQSSQPH